MTELSPSRLVEQTKNTIAMYLDYAVERIDAVFGHGYAKDHPELVGAFIRSCADDFATGMLDNGIDNLVNAISDLNSTIDRNA